MPDVPAHVVGAGSGTTGVVSVRADEVDERVLLECTDGTREEACADEEKEGRHYD